MGMRLRHRDPVIPGTPAAPAARPARGSSIARTLRTAWWPRFLVAGLARISMQRIVPLRLAELEAEAPVLPPGDGGVGGQVGLAQDG